MFMYVDRWLGPPVLPDVMWWMHSICMLAADKVSDMDKGAGGYTGVRCDFEYWVSDAKSKIRLLVYQNL